ncbi:MAG: hypothetical protein COA36_04015 [Desulfotalea sp.]|nr:MAG: hypothetical protein COA36_04015 [Desulfotalea sp.]
MAKKIQNIGQLKILLLFATQNGRTTPLRSLVPRLPVFCKRRQDMVKMLYWAENGFCIWMKRLEKESFRWPESENDVLEVSQVTLGWLLNGLDVSQAHHSLHYSSTG